MALASKASLVVAASMSAVEALKDQFGLCRWNYIINNLNRHSISNPIARPSGQFRHVTSAAAVAVEQSGAKVSAAEEMRRRRRAEKMEKVINLVCWGPN